MKLYLATIHQQISEYMGDSRVEEHTRLVWANDTSEATLKCKIEYTDEDPYGLNKWVRFVHLTEAL